jgi:hypothetical protein
MTSGSLEAWRSTRRRRHSTTGHRLSEGSRCGIKVVASDWVIDETTVLIELRPEVFVICGLPASLALIEVLLVEGANPIGTLLRVVCRVFWGQRTQSESHPAGVAVFIIWLVQVLRLLWEFGVLVFIAWDIMMSIRGMDVDRRNHELRLAIITIVTTGNIAGRQGNTRNLRCRLAVPRVVW